MDSTPSIHEATIIWNSLLTPCKSQHVLHWWLKVVLHNKLGIEHAWNGIKPFCIDMLMLPKHAKITLLPVFMEQPLFEIDIWHLLNLSMCYTGD